MATYARPHLAQEFLNFPSIRRGYVNKIATRVILPVSKTLTFKEIARLRHDGSANLAITAEGPDYQSEMATAIEGSSLTVALEEPNKMLFLELLKLCRSVVCCRVSPIQKAQVRRYFCRHA
jgi:magnesium-transporting ATPase (P-type)